jgi:TrmH family RNA methyltransferase
MAVGVTSSTTISSGRNPLVRHAVRLRDNRFRQKQREVIVDGFREIERAIDGGLRLKTLFVGRAGDQAALGPAIEQPVAVEGQQSLIKKAKDAVVTLTPELMAQVAYGGNPREAVAVFEQPDDRTLGRLKLGPQPLVIVMVGIEKPGNAGAIFRSADAVGADAVVLCEASCDLFNPNLIRASLGTVFTVPCAEASEAETIAWLRQGGLTSYAAIVGAKRTMWEVDYRGPSAIVVGSEAQGLGPLWREKTDLAGHWAGEMVAVSIPMLGAADSLNVSVTTAALLFEARRQRSAEFTK